MKNMVSSPNPLLDDGTCISDELIGRLHYATEDRALDLVAAFTANDRAGLAMFCYRKSHLRRIGLATQPRAICTPWCSIGARFLAKPFLPNRANVPRNQVEWGCGHDPRSPSLVRLVVTILRQSTLMKFLNRLVRYRQSA